MQHQVKLELMDTHAGGDVSRIVTGGIMRLPGTSVRQQMEFLRDQADGLRRLLLEEPYGIPEMSVDLIVPASHPDADWGYIIMEVMGYPIYSGSNTICTATALLESGLIKKQEGVQTFTLEAPAGLVQIEAQIQDGVVEAITCEGLPSYIHTYKASIEVPGIGPVTYSIAYSGGFYALVEAAELGFVLEASEERALADTAHAIVEAITAETAFEHYALGNVGPLPFLHFMGPVLQLSDTTYRSRSATYVHPGVICRSTTGTGTSARLALMQYEGLIEPGDSLETVSLRDTRFVGTYTGLANQQGQDVVENRITGRSFVLNRAEVIANEDDAMLSPEVVQSLRVLATNRS
ncbi:proline racemase family protein [Marinobacterium stanieri]|uniref:proline racemase family protein n=1 Tax=Marinobacterium stanieri TaxID=49186 RepID=UPI003A935AAB